MKRWLNNLEFKYFFLLVMNSPFKPLKLHWYYGDIIAAPHRWVNSKNGRVLTASKYLGWHFYTLCWKTKWDEYRFEYSPRLSIILFNKQIIITFTPGLSVVALDCYWEAYLYYRYRTDSKLSKEERLLKVMEIYSCKWKTLSNGEETLNDYYNDILREKYLKFVNNG